MSLLRGVECAAVSAAATDSPYHPPSPFPTRRFSTSDSRVVTASDKGRIFFWPIRPFSTRGTLDMLRSRPGAQPTRGFIESLNFVNTWSDVNLPGRQATTALHVLAEASANGTYWGEAKGELGQYEHLLNEWANSDAAYAPVRNADGATPLEVALLTGNHRFFDALCEKKGIMGPDGSGSNDDDDDGGTPSRSVITVRDLSAMLDWSSSVEAAVQYLQRPMLLKPTPRTLQGCDSFDFIEHFSTGAYETCASDFGVGAPKYLWQVYRQSHNLGAEFHARQDAIKLYSAQASKLNVSVMCDACRHYRAMWTKATNGSRTAVTESYFVDVEGLSGATCGRDVLRKLVIGGKRTEAAFAGPALRVIVSCVVCCVRRRAPRRMLPPRRAHPHASLCAVVSCTPCAQVQVEPDRATLLPPQERVLLCLPRDAGVSVVCCFAR